MTRRGSWLAALAGIAALAVLVGAEAAQEITKRNAAVRTARAMTGGNPVRATEAIQRLGCGSCHRIPGITGAVGRVGPPLAQMAARSYIAGVMPNTAENMILWLRWPQGVLPKSAMPNTGASDAEARDIAAYLFTLR